MNEIESLLIICQANICRSPMAQSLFRKKLDSDSFSVHSAGVEAIDGQSIDKTVIKILDERDLPYSEIKSSRLNKVLAMNHDLLLPMTKKQIKIIQNRYSSLRGRCYLLGKWRGWEIDDPFGKDESDYKESFIKIEKCVDDWIEKLT